MAEIVNLRRARKAKARAAGEAAAAQNRAKFGEAPALRELRQAREQQQAERLARHLRRGEQPEER